MAFEAQTLADSLFTNWTLTGERLGKKTEAGIERPVLFFGHDQQPNQRYTNAIEVIKQSPISIERSTEYFTLSEDVFEIRIIHNREGADDTIWQQHETDVEDIETEINRIIKLIYNPQTGTGVWFTSDLIWKNDDALSVSKPYFYRILNIRLTRIIPRNTKSFTSYKRGVLLDVSESEGAGLPASDYQYTEVFNVSDEEGFRDHELPVNMSGDGDGVPWHYSGRFESGIVLSMYLKSTDIGTGGHQLPRFWQKLSNGQQPEITLIRTYTNDNAETLTITSKLILLKQRTSEPPHDQVTVNIIGKHIGPSIYTIA